MSLTWCLRVPFPPPKNVLTAADFSCLPVFFFMHTCVFAHVSLHYSDAFGNSCPTGLSKMIGPFSNQMAEGESEPGAEGDPQDLPERE